MTDPLTTDPVIARFYEDLNTRCIYEIDESDGTYHLVSCPEPGNKTTVGPIPPLDPEVGDIWIDDSVDPAISYIWDGTSWVQQGTAPDIAAPVKPEIISARSTTEEDVEQQEDGTNVVRIAGVVGWAVAPSGLVDLDSFVIQFTREVMPDLVSPNWSLASERVIAAGDAMGAVDTPFTISPVLPAASYTLRAYAVDRSGNRSTESDPVTLITAADLDAPSRPTNIVTAGGHKTIGVRWAPITAADFAYTEIGWKKSTDAAFSESIQTGGTLVVIVGVENGDPSATPPVVVTYNVRLRSVDTSGNTLHDTGVPDVDGNPVYVTLKASDPDVGWVAAPDAYPSPIPGNTLVWDSAIIGDVFAGEINADWINVGTMRLGNAPPDLPPTPLTEDVALEVYNAAGKLVGHWVGKSDGATVPHPIGIEVFDPAHPTYKLRITESSLIIYNDLPNATEVVSITPLGIDAASITFGSARGGHNLIQNSSFEMGGFGSQTQIDVQWDAKADYDASRLGTDTNVTGGSPGDLHMTSTT